MMNLYSTFALALGLTATLGAVESPTDPSSLAAEVRALGWIAFTARSDAGDWDLFLMRPDGSERRTLTQTQQWNEAAPQFSRNGRKLLYRRLPRAETIDGNRYGAQGKLIVANSDGSLPVEIGADGEYSWASWSPNGEEFAVLSLKGISLLDARTGKVQRTLSRRGFFQQLTWSPDGKWLLGVANSFGTGWSVAKMDALTGEATALNTVDCCTPDWFPDTRHVIFSWRPPGQKGNGGYGWTQLWRVDANGKDRQLVYGEDGRHIYGGHVSPDGKYVLFTGNPQENGDPEHRGAPMGLLRLKDAPMIRGESAELRARYPDAQNGPVLTLPAGWEPCWTSSDIPAEIGASTTHSNP